MERVRLLIFSVMLVYCICSLYCSMNLKKIGDLHKVPEALKKFGQFRFHFFTVWNFGLQIAFLVLAVLDETSKLIKLSALQIPVEKARNFLFSTVVFPSSLVVMTIFWGIWHIDRELIFPKVIDEFYPSWLNHTLHTLIIVPLAAEILCQSGNKDHTVSRKQAAVILLTYSLVYKILYLSVYFQHGIWLYPIYNLFNWGERVIFILFQLSLLIVYQQVGISLLGRKRVKESNKKLT